MTYLRRVLWLLLGIVIGAVASVAGTDLTGRQQLTLQLYDQWTTPEMRQAVALAGRAEALARQKARSEELMRYLEHQVSAEDVESYRRHVARSAEATEALNSLDAIDATRRVAIFYERIYALAGVNRLDRELLASLLGSPSRFWAGYETPNASGYTVSIFPGERSFYYWSEHADELEELAQVRTRAALGAALVARDHDYGAPNRWLQVLGFNESTWERRERAVQERREREGDSPAGVSEE